MKFLLAVLIVVGAGLGQDSRNITLSPDKERRIVPNDVLDVFILRMPELSKTYQVRADGSIDLPFVGKVEAQQKTATEVAKLIADRLRPDYVVDPQVSVVVKPASQQFFIQGSIHTPGVYNIDGKPSLWQLITIAGGLNPTFGSTAFIIRTAKPDSFPTNATNEEGENQPPPSFEMIKADIRSLIRGDFKENLLLQPNDIVQIPAADLFFVAGDVNGPGAFPLTPETTLRQAISLARGTTRTASAGKTIIFREDANGQKTELKVDVDAVMQGRKEDLAIKANDIIMIPNSKAKSILIPMVSAFGIGAATLPTSVIR